MLIGYKGRYWAINPKSYRILNTIPSKVMTIIITLVAFVFNIFMYDLASASPLQQAPDSQVNTPSKKGTIVELNVDTFALPEYMGIVKYRRNANMHKAKSASQPSIVIHIQDAHCNYYAQHKISEILGYLNKEYGLDSINLEGGSGEYNLSILSGINKGDIRKNVADSFVKDGIVSGPEYFAINNPDAVRLWGIEDAKFYAENLKVYRDLITHKEEIDKNVTALRHILSNLKRHIYPKDLFDFDLQYTSYKENKLELREYLKFLLAKAAEKGIDVTQYKNIRLLEQSLAQEKTIDFKKANSERDLLIDRLQKKLGKNALEEFIAKVVEFRTEKISQGDFYNYLIKKSDTVGIDLALFSELQKYAGYIHIYSMIDTMSIADEMEIIENAIKDRLCENSDQKTLASLSKNLTLLKNIFAIAITPDDYKYYKKNENDFEVKNYLQFINKNAPLYKISAKVDAVSDLDGYRENMNRFYEYSLKRDRAFIKNIKLSEKTQKSKAAILVTGGFHSENIQELFAKDNISYISIMPNFKNRDGYECPYFNVLAGKQTPLDPRLASLLNSSLATASLLNRLGIEIDASAERTFRFTALVRAAMGDGDRVVVTNGPRKSVVIDDHLNVIDSASKDGLPVIDAARMIHGSGLPIPKDLREKNVKRAGNDAATTARQDANQWAAAKILSRTYGEQSEEFILQALREGKMDDALPDGTIKDITKMIRSDPGLARDIVFYGGIVRDLLTGSAESKGDLDLVVRVQFNTREAKLNYDRRRQIALEKTRNSAKALLRVIAASQGIEAQSDEMKEAMEEIESSNMTIRMAIGKVSIDVLGAIDDDERLYYWDVMAPDCTINHIGLSARGNIFDPDGGLYDLDSRGQLRIAHFEDPLVRDRIASGTILRAVRFKHQYGFSYSPELKDFIRDYFISPNRSSNAEYFLNWVDGVKDVRRLSDEYRDILLDTMRDIYKKEKTVSALGALERDEYRKAFQGVLGLDDFSEYSFGLWMRQMNTPLGKGILEDVQLANRQIWAAAGANFDVLSGIARKMEDLQMQEWERVNPLLANKVRELIGFIEERASADPSFEMIVAMARISIFNIIPEQAFRYAEARANGESTIQIDEEMENSLAAALVDNLVVYTTQEKNFIGNTRKLVRDIVRYADNPDAALRELEEIGLGGLLDVVNVNVGYVRYGIADITIGKLVSQFFMRIDRAKEKEAVSEEEAIEKQLRISARTFSFMPLTQKIIFMNKLNSRLMKKNYVVVDNKQAGDKLILYKIEDRIYHEFLRNFRGTAPIRAFHVKRITQPSPDIVLRRAWCSSLTTGDNIFIVRDAVYQHNLRKVKKVILPGGGVLFRAVQPETAEGKRIDKMAEIAGRLILKGLGALSPADRVRVQEETLILHELDHIRRHDGTLKTDKYTEEEMADLRALADAREPFNALAEIINMAVCDFPHAWSVLARLSENSNKEAIVSWLENIAKDDSSAEILRSSAAAAYERATETQDELIASVPVVESPAITTMPESRMLALDDNFNLEKARTFIAEARAEGNRLLLIFDLDKTLSKNSSIRISGKIARFMANAMNIGDVDIAVLTMRDQEEIDRRVLSRLKEIGFDETAANFKSFISVPQAGMKYFPDRGISDKQLVVYKEEIRRLLGSGVTIKDIKPGEAAPSDENYFKVGENGALTCALYGIVLKGGTDPRGKIIRTLREKGINAYQGGRASINIFPVNKGDAVEKIVETRGIDKSKIAIIGVDDDYVENGVGRPLLEKVAALGGLALTGDDPQRASYVNPSDIPDGAYYVTERGPKICRAVLKACFDGRVENGALKDIGAIPDADEDAADATDAVIDRRTATIAAFNAADGKSDIVKIVVGLPAGAEYVSQGRSVSRMISKKLADSGFGLTRQNIEAMSQEYDTNQVFPFYLDVNDPEGTQKSYDAAIAKAENSLQEDLATAPDGKGHIAIFAPQMDHGPRFAEATKNQYQKDVHITVIPDAYTDCNAKEDRYTDIMIRVALGRSIAYYYNSKDQNGALANINRILGSVADGYAPIFTIDDLLSILKPLRIRPINYKSIDDWKRSQEATAVSA